MAKQKLVALLPMKRHSERIPNKNFRVFAGKPLFQWILETLLAVDAIDTVVINTDARDLLEQHDIVASDRVVIRDRRAEICGDTVSMNLVLADDIRNVDSDAYLMTHTTNPLLHAATIEEAVRRYQTAIAGDTADSLFSVNRFQTRFYREDGSAVNHDPANLLRTQDLEPWYEENSNIYIFSRDSFLATEARIGTRPIMFETPPLESSDIDDQAGWDLAELIGENWYAPEGVSH